MNTYPTVLMEEKLGKSGSASRCRFCGTRLKHTFADLGMSPLCETYPGPDELNNRESFYPLHVYVCEECYLVQLDAYESPEHIFSEYAYFSSYSDSWLSHARRYCEAMIDRLSLAGGHQVIEVASNDGYLLQYFVERGVPVLGIEPAANVARAATTRGVPTLVEFFGAELAARLHAEGKAADLIAANNVLAQVPDLNDFVEGLRILLKPAGVLTLEFPHLKKLIDHNEFDTIYHEHFSYFSLHTVVRLLAAHGLRVFDVEELRTHGGSLRVFASRVEDPSRVVQDRVAPLLESERQAGLTSLAGYLSFQDSIKHTKWALLDFLIQAKRANKSVAGYGAPGKGTTLLHYCGIGKDLLEFTVDRSSYKQGRYLPGNHIPIFEPEQIRRAKPDYVVILPWNIKDEIMEQMSYIREWGGQFIVPIPELKVY